MVVLLTDEGFTGFHGLSLALLAGALAAAGAWSVVFGWRWLATRPKLPDAGLETREVGPEPPAIVNLLVNRWNVTRSAIQATLLDLASRKYCGIDQYGQEQFVVRMRGIPPDAQTTAYERQVLDLIRKRATGGSAPAEAITLGEEGEAEAWWKRFRKSVAEDARKQRLARNRWAALDWAILGSGWPYVSGCSRWLLESPTLVDGTIRAKTRSTLRTGWESAWSPGLERWPCYRGCGICVTRRPGARRVRAGSVSESTCARFMRLTMSLRRR